MGQNIPNRLFWARDNDDEEKEQPQQLH